MIGYLKKAGEYVGAAQVWASIISFLVSLTTAVLAYLYGLPAYEVIKQASVVLCACLATAYYTFLLFGRLKRYIGTRRQQHRMSENLREMELVGHKEISLGDAANMWTEMLSNPHAFSFNVCLRRLKKAAKNGQIEIVAYGRPPMETQGFFGRGVRLGRQQPIQNSTVNLAQLRDFFESGAWEKIE